MPGLVKRKHNKDNCLLRKSITISLRQISEILPVEYNKITILNIFKELYPRQWNELFSRYQYYKDKDKNLKKNGKKPRFYHKKPEDFLFELAIMKKMLSSEFKDEHAREFNETIRNEKYSSLKTKRAIKNEIYHKKIKENNRLSQSIEPLYLDLFIYQYHKKDTTIKDKLEILSEIKKFNCRKSIRFLQKINDSERNDQVRREAFNHLQKSGIYVKLRKKFKGKQKSYHKETDEFSVTPSDLKNRLESNTIQRKKTFDIFISHSFLDNDIALKMKEQFNKHKLSVYLDWTSDCDFLRREMAGEYTIKVLKERIFQSKIVVFLQSNNSTCKGSEIKSDWIEMELSFAKEVNKEILCINFTNEENNFNEITTLIEDDEIIIDTSSIEKIKSLLNNQPD